MRRSIVATDQPPVGLGVLCESVEVGAAWATAVWVSLGALPVLVALVAAVAALVLPVLVALVLPVATAVPAPVLSVLDGAVGSLPAPVVTAPLFVVSAR